MVHALDVRQQIAKELGVSTKVLDSWLVTVNTVRNICAHHGRLWNRIIGNPPMIPRASEWHDPHEVKNDKMFGTLTVLSCLLERVAPDTEWRARLLGKVLKLSRRNQERMGFADNLRLVARVRAIGQGQRQINLKSCKRRNVVREPSAVTDPSKRDRARAVADSDVEGPRGGTAIGGLLPCYVGSD